MDQSRSPVVDADRVGSSLPPEAAPPRARRRRRWVWPAVLIAAAAVGAALWWPRAATEAKAQVPPGRGAGARGGGVPVVAASAQQGTIDVFVNGLGTVTPIATVTVKSRVDGQLMAVHFREGETVRQGDLLAEIDPRPFQVQLAQAEGQLARDQALLENAKTDLARYESLIAQNAVPDQQVATQKALIAQYQGAIESDRAALDSARLSLTYSRITAPIGGRVGLRLVDPGNIVHANDANGLLVITQLQPISVIFTLAEGELPAVVRRVAAGARLRVDAYDRDMKTRLATGTLATFDNQIDQSTGTLKLRAVFDNAANELFPNQFVNARLLVEERHGATLIPTAAVERNNDAMYVWLVKPDSSVAVRPITTGASEADQTEVTSGLEPGAVVVVTGVDKLQEGQKVSASMGSGPGRARAAR